jgi:hypothetical protein
VLPSFSNSSLIYEVLAYPKMQGKRDFHMGKLIVGSWELGVGSWEFEFGVASWELGVGGVLSDATSDTMESWVSVEENADITASSRD